METLGDKLRNELTLPDWFEDAVVNDIRNCGKASFSCDRNQQFVNRDGFPIRYEPVLIQWAKDNGFNYSFRYSFNGKYRAIEFTL